MSPGSSETQKALPERGATETLEFHWRACGVEFSLSTPTRAMWEAVRFQYCHMECTPSEADATTTVRVEAPKTSGDGHALRIGAETVATLEGTGQLLHELDNRLAYVLQCRVPNLYFVHAASFARGDEVTMVSGESGAGKSTTALALCAAGLRYLSDELSPIDTERGCVLPYPRAICLKQAPPEPLELPPSTLRTEWTLHVEARAAGATVDASPARLARLVFLTGERRDDGPLLRRLSSAEGAMRLYQNALNQLAHPGAGLDDTIALVSTAECYELARAEIGEMLGAFAEIGAL